MLLKNLQSLIQAGTIKTFHFNDSNKRVLYVHTASLYDFISREDWEEIKGWNTICILSSPSGHPNPCFYFNWGYGGNPDYMKYITILE